MECKLTGKSLKGKTLVDVFTNESQEACSGYLEARMRELKSGVGMSWPAPIDFARFLGELREVAKLLWQEEVLLDRSSDSKKIIKKEGCWRFWLHLSARCLEALNDVIELLIKNGSMRLDHASLPPKIDDNILPILPLAVAAIAAGVKPRRCKLVMRCAMIEPSQSFTTWLAAVLVNEIPVIDVQVPFLSELLEAKERQLSRLSQPTILMYLATGPKDKQEDIATLLFLRDLRAREIIKEMSAAVKA
jgi:hypothetical protein